MSLSAASSFSADATGMGYLALAFVLAAEPDHLALAAEHLDRGDSTQAITHLTSHVRSHPREAMTRAYLAELLFQSNRHAEATAEFEAFIAQAQTMTGKPHDHLIHCHTRLMSVAMAVGDEHREHLHRGIGLWRLVKRWDATSPDAATSEATLIQALEALHEAARLKPRDARTQLYLAEVQSRLGLPASLQPAKTLIPLGLTSAERERLSTFE